jgi:predicted Zn-dependent protease
MTNPSFFRRSACFLLALCLALSGLLSPRAAGAWGEFTIKDEKELGDKFNVLIRSRMPLVQDTEIVNYVADMVARLTRTLPPQPFPFTVSVIRHNAVNAFACPGGYIFVHTGLLLSMGDESEVAGVIAHEMAHVTQRHIARRIESSQMVSLLSVVGMLAGAFLGGEGGAAAVTGSMAASQAAMLNYSRNDEREADQVGMSYLTRAGYAPQGMGAAFEVLSRRQWLMGSTLPTYLSTHPGLAERVRDMGVRVARLPASQRSVKTDNTRFLRVQALVRARYSDTQSAIQAFSRQMNGPGRCVALMGMGILAARQNHVADAARHFEEALACAPSDALIVREAGQFHYSKGDRSQGGILLARAVSMNSDDIYALFYQARNLADLGRTAEAVELARRVLRKVPEDAEVHDLLARLYGSSRQMFLANLHMAYGGLYEHNERKVRQFYDKAKNLAKTPQETDALERFEKQYKDIKEFWK